MRLSAIIGKVATVALLVSAATSIPAQNDAAPWNFPDFSATQIIQTGAEEIPTKVYRSGSSVRVERGTTLATLFVTASSKVYNLVVYPDGQRSCVVATPEKALVMPSPLDLLFGDKVKRTPAGTEVVEGHTCKVEKVVVTRTSGTTIESKVWEAEDLKGIPVKIESQHPGGAHFIAVYRDIVLGTPDKALFTPPEKCTPLDKMWQEAEHKVYE